jgi:hypothetical protein
MKKKESTNAATPENLEQRFDDGKEVVNYFMKRIVLRTPDVCFEETVNFFV